MSLTLGIDIGGTKIAGGLVTNTGEVVTRAHCPTPTAQGGQAVLAAAIALALSLRAQAARPVTAIGIGAAGQVDCDRGMIVHASEIMPGWAGTSVAAAFENALGLPAKVDNDVNALARGEAKFGRAQGAATALFLAVGTGLGGAMLLAGRVHHGAHWSGGEVGSLLLSIDPLARRGLSGEVGTWEAYVSGPGLVQTWRDLTGVLTGDVSGYDIAEEAKYDAGSLAALAVTRTGEYLGYGLVSLANVLDPDLIVVGGGLAALGDLLLGPARAILASRALPGPATCPVVAASLGADAAVIGAAALVMPL